MNHFCLSFSYLVLLFILPFQVQLTFCQYDQSTEDIVSNYEPSLAMFVGILGFMFLSTFILFLYRRFCSRVSSRRADQQIHPGITRSSSRFSGIDKRAIQALPFFRFSSLKGSKEGLECAVCLSMFEDIAILRLLPICRHAFHIHCIDQWLENHSTCPLCRKKLNAAESTIFTNYCSSRSLRNNSELSEVSDIELFVQMEEDDQGSSRFSVGGSFRKIENATKQYDSLLEESAENVDQDQEVFDKVNHKIMISDILLKNRWSNVSSSDLVCLELEILDNYEAQLSDTGTLMILSNMYSKNILLPSDSSNRFSSASDTRSSKNDEKLKIEEIESKILLENKIGTTNNSILSSNKSTNKNSIKALGYVALGEKRSMSEITGVSRYEDLITENSTRHSSILENNVNNERVRQLWLCIARRTVQCFANRERRPLVVQKTTQPLDV